MGISLEHTDSIELEDEQKKELQQVIQDGIRSIQCKKDGCTTMRRSGWLYCPEHLRKLHFEHDVPKIELVHPDNDNWSPDRDMNGDDRDRQP